MEVGLNFETDSVLHSSRFHEICVLRTEILTFHQNDKESIGVAWARFTLLVNQCQTCHYPSIYCSSIFMLVLTRSLHTISILPLDDLLLILPQPRVGKSSTKSWIGPLSFVSTSQFPQSPRCVKRNLQKSNQNPLKAN